MEVEAPILALGLVAAGLLPASSGETDPVGAQAYPLRALALEAALALIVILGTVTVIQRILHVRAQASREVRERRS